VILQNVDRLCQASAMPSGWCGDTTNEAPVEVRSMFCFAHDLDYAIIAINESRVCAMGSLSVRNLDEDLLGRLKRRAAKNGRSAEAEVRAILGEALSGESEPNFDDLAAELRALTVGRKQTPAEVLQREGRAER
jgi:plasmid stability protein